MGRASSYLDRYFPTKVEENKLRRPFARSLAALLTSGNYAGATLVECRHSGAEFAEMDVVIVDLSIGLGQRVPVNDVRAIERVVIVVGSDRFIPSICPLREDFPSDVPHLNLTIADEPGSLCLFEMSTDDLRRILTPWLLLERSCHWMVETAHGRLHADDQPLDPNFEESGAPLLLPPLDAIAEHPTTYCGFRVSGHRGAPFFLIAESKLTPEQRQAAHSFSVILLRTKALPHARIRALPRNVGELLGVFNELGIDLLQPLRQALRAWRSTAFGEKLLKQTCVIVICTPIERSPGVIGSYAVKAYGTGCSAEDFAVAVGALLRCGEQLAPPLTDGAPDADDLQNVVLRPMDVFRQFDRTVALTASGIDPEPERPRAITLVGAGALGSQIALTSSRMGLGTWTIIDPDHLMPHNLARHALTARYLGWAKAEAVGHEISDMFGQGVASALVMSVESDALPAPVLGSADLIVDASASVQVARWLAIRSGHQTQTVSTFLSPSGRDLVVLAEGRERTPRLDHVEMSYYWRLATDEDLRGHLSDARTGFFPSGGCRRPSMRISQADVGALSAIAAKRVIHDPLAAAGVIEIWRKSDDGIKVVRSTPSQFSEVMVGDWTISVSEEVIEGIQQDREDAGSHETGGILIGTWDRLLRRGYIVGYCPPPPDSESSATGFVRGAIGVHRTLTDIETATAMNLTYLGEWHTHPPQCSSSPSGDDKILLRWIAHIVDYSDVPAVMMIMGEDGLRILVGSTTTSALLGS